MTLQHVLVDTAGPDEEGRLVFVDDKLVALLVHLTAQHDDEGLRGLWFLEAGFGQLDGPAHPTFETVEAAQSWIAERLATRG